MMNGYTAVLPGNASAIRKLDRVAASGATLSVLEFLAPLKDRDRDGP
jgi:hypothetical protein